MHEFQVGDVFQYRGEGEYNVTTPVTTIGIRKYRIVSKSATPSSRTYVAEVLYRTQGYTNLGPLPVLTGHFGDTLVHLDSAGHGLNGCQGEVVPMPGPGWGQTRVEVGQGDSGWFSLASPDLRMKQFKERVSNPGDPVTDAPTYAVIYAEGLGAVRTTVGPGLTQPGSHEILTGYIRNGDLTGEVTSDQELLQPVSLRPGSSAGRTLHSGISGMLPGTPFDLRGRSLRQSGIRIVLLTRELCTQDSPGVAAAFRNYCAVDFRMEGAAKVRASMRAAHARQPQGMP